MNVLLLTSHAIAEHDDLEMFTRMGVPTYSIGGAYDELLPFEGKRPAIANLVRYPELEAATNEQRARMHRQYGDAAQVIDWAKARLAPEVIDWADTIIVHHFPEAWIGGQWNAIRDKRVIWRTCGQSDPRLESVMARYVEQGLQVVRYSPKEREAFTQWGAFAGESTMIRFGKDPAEWSGWTGNGHITAGNGVAIGTPRDPSVSAPFVGNITQDMKQRGDACGYDFWTEATAGLNARPAGPGSEALPGGVGSLTYDGMREYLRACRVYLYTGTRPASYTLGLIEAMMTGTPVVSIGTEHFQPAALFEAHEITRAGANSPDVARRWLTQLLSNPGEAAELGGRQQARAIELFGLDGVMAAWHDFLGTVAA